MTRAMTVTYNNDQKSVDLVGLIIENDKNKIIVAVPTNQLKFCKDDFWESEAYSLQFEFMEYGIVNIERMISSNRVGNVTVICFDKGQTK